MKPAELERLLDRSLRDLPSPRAPGTLLPRVMTAVQQWAQRPWYTREWLAWPVRWQAASAIAALIVVAGVTVSARAAEVWSGGTLGAGILSAIEALGGSLAPAVGDTATHASTTTNAAWIVWRVVMAPFVAYAAAIVTLTCVACAVLATALNHLAFGKALPR